MRRKKLLHSIASLVFLAGSSIAPLQARAASMFEQIQTGATKAGDAILGTKTTVTQNSFVTSLFVIINGLLTLIGIVFLLLMIYAGYTWTMARGNEQSVETAKTHIKQAVIGLIVILTARMITEFILRNIGTALPS